MSSTGRRALLALPQVLLFGGMILMLVVHPNAFTSALHSTRALLVNALLLTAWLLVSLVLLPRLIKSAWWDSAILSTVAIAALLVLVVPTLRDVEVVEEFPAAVADTMAPASTTPGTPTPPTTTVPPPERISTADLKGIGHDASGTASIYRRADGSTVVALEDINIEPGPDYRVLVVRGSERERPGDGLELEALRGNQGTQYYEVPPGTEPGPGWTVLVWCRAFGVPVANASQSAS